MFTIDQPMSTARSATCAGFAFAFNPALSVNRAMIGHGKGHADMDAYRH